MSAAKDPIFVSVDDYLQAEELATIRHEYIEGWVRAMTGATNRHNRVKLNAIMHLAVSLKGRPCFPCDSDTKVRIRRHGSTKFYYPDAQVVCESNAPTDVFQDKPVVIIEVLSPSTRATDLDEKLNAYLTIESLDFYIILEQHQPLAIVIRRTDAGFIRQVYEGTDAVIELPVIGCELPLFEVYASVAFTTDCVNEPDVEYELS